MRRKMLLFFICCIILPSLRSAQELCRIDFCDKVVSFEGRLNQDVQFRNQFVGLLQDLQRKFDLQEKRIEDLEKRLHMQEMTVGNLQYLVDSETEVEPQGQGQAASEYDVSWNMVKSLFSKVEDVRTKTLQVEKDLNQEQTKRNYIESAVKEAEATTQRLVNDLSSEKVHRLVRSAVSDATQNKCVKKELCEQ